MNQHYQNGIVKIVSVRGDTDNEGAIQVNIHSSEANLSVGRWLMCIDSLVVTPLFEFTKDFPATVSATHSFSHIVDIISCRLVQRPARQLLFVLRHDYPDTPFVLADSRTVWLEVQYPRNSFTLLFQNAETDAGLKLKVQGQLLFMRVVQ